MVAASMPSRLGVAAGWSLGVCLLVAAAASEAEARGLAPEPSVPAVPEPAEGQPAPAEPAAPAQPVDSSAPGFEQLSAQADERHAAGAHAESAALYGRAFRSRPDPQRGDATGEAAVRSAMVEYELAATKGDELALRQEELELLEEFLEARRRTRAAAQIDHVVPVPEVPEDLLKAVDALQLRIAELAEQQRIAEEEAVAPESIEPDPGVGSTKPKLAPRPRHRIIYSNLTAARYNPLGLVNEFTGGYRYQLVDKGDSVLFNESFVAAQVHTFLSPAYGRIGPKIDIQPLALLNLSATYDFIGFFNTFGLNQSFKSPTDDWSDTEISRRDDSGDPAIDNYAHTGHFVTLAALLQAKVKNIAVRNNLRFYWSDYDLRAGDTISYDQTLDIPLPDRGWVVSNDLDVLYLFDMGLTLGARYTLTEAFYRPRHFQPAEPVSHPNGPTHRVGPALLYTFFNRPHQRFNKPTLIVLVQWWAAHRFRTGEDVSAAVPYFVLGFRFEGDILPDPATWNEKTEPKRKRRRPR